MLGGTVVDTSPRPAILTPYLHRLTPGSCHRMPKYLYQPPLPSTARRDPYADHPSIVPSPLSVLGIFCDYFIYDNGSHADSCVGCSSSNMRKWNLLRT
jgi:hypothetical protein